MKFGFGDHVLDEDRFELRCGDRIVDVQPKALSLLLHLVRHRDRVVGKQELFEAIWPGLHVTDGSLARAMSIARRAIGDSSREPSVLVTVSRRGHRFVAPVKILGTDGSAPAGRRSYVGREALLARARSVVESALGGRGRILMLTGEPGVGKSRTAELLSEWARDARAEVAAAWGSDAGSPTYWSWTRILRGLATAHPRAISGLSPAQRRHLARILPEAAAGAAPLPTFEGDVARFRLFEAVRSFLDRIMRERPLALFLDDLHATDAESTALLEFVGQGLSDCPMVVVLTHRDMEAARAPHHARTLERLLRLPCVERLPITGLHGPDLAEYVRTVLGRDPGDALREALERQTGGNPLLLGESLRSLEARGMLGIERERIEWESLLPRSIEYLIDAKLHPLSADAHALLAAAAAIGIEVDPALLAACLPEIDEVEPLIREVADAGLLTPGVGSGAHRFSHVLIRNAVYDALAPPGSARRELHFRIAAALDRSPAAAAVSLSERAHHACEAAPLVDPERAAALARESAEQAARLQDFEGAAAWYERALTAHSLVHRPTPTAAALLWLGLGIAQIPAAGLERARVTLRRAALEARGASRPDLFARAALAYADRPNSAGHPDADVIALLEEATACLPASEGALRIRVASRLAAEHRYGDRALADRLAETAITAARALGDCAVLAQALDDATFVRWSLVDSRAWIELNAEAAGMARLAGDEILEFSGNKGCVTGHLELGDVVGVHRAIRDCARTAQMLRTPNARWWMEVLEATEDLLAGELESAERHVVASMHLAERVSAPDVSLEMQAQYVYLRLEQGRAAEIEPAAREQARRFPDQPAWRAAHGRVLVACGRTVEAADLLASLSARDFADVPRDRVWLGTHALAAEVAHACGDSRAAQVLERVLSPHAALGVLLSSVLYYGPVAHYLGLVAATQSHWDRAVAHFEAALDIESRVCAHVFSARTRVALARALSARGASGDRARAVTLIAEALETADRKGLAEIADAARSLEPMLWKRPAGSQSGRKKSPLRKEIRDR